jgi:hypothetical protein
MRQLIVLAVAAAGLFAAPLAQAGSDTDRATGGGQVLINTRGGAGDTIAFTAQETATGAKGQVQYVDRTATGQTVHHGRVTCLVVDGTTATIGGTWERGATGGFEILVTDNGEGATATDMITIADVTTPDCGDPEQDEEDQIALARGNAQVYDAP